ncbi:MAG TPA: hypothetical protein PLV61_10400 [Parvularculaceae bacterium]|nr:ribbon-helix-helix protein, CopG family [Caulobacterales bacterium]HPE31595.1 hypothetical protein [Parvularculaceae bacterium]
MSTRKRRVSIYLTPEAERLLTRAVEDRGASMSGVVEAALTALLGDKTRNSELALLGERVTKLARAAERIADETTAQTETLALYILYYLCITPPLPDASRDAAEAMGRKRFDRFIGQVSERLLGKESYTDEVLARIDLVRANSAPKLGVAS